MSWEEKRLDDLGLVARGRSRHRPRDAAHLYDGPYPFVKTGDVKHADQYLTSYPPTIIGLRTIGGGWRCWRRQCGSFTGNGSSASVSQATNTPASSTVCRRAGNAQRLRTLLSFNVVSIFPSRQEKLEMCQST